MKPNAKKLTRKAYEDLLVELRKLDKWFMHKVTPLVHYCNYLRDENTRLTTELNRLQNVNMFDTNVVKEKKYVDGVSTIIMPKKTPLTDEQKSRIENLRLQGFQGVDLWKRVAEIENE